MKTDKAKKAQAKRYLLSFAILLIFGPNMVVADDLQIKTAVRSALAGDYLTAEKIYSQIIMDNPTDLEARLGRARIYSWQKKFTEAKYDFEFILQADPDHQAALLGYAYNFSWEGNYDIAEDIFRRVLINDPANIEAKKGLAYVALWSGKYDKAVNLFQEMWNQNSDDVEMGIALGQSYLSSGRSRDARLTFKKLLESHPRNIEVQKWYASLQNSSARWEIGMWGGYSGFADTGELGIRSLDIQYRPSQSARLWSRYDNSLSLDNLNIIRQQQSIGTYYIGASNSWNSTFFTRAQFGIRSFPDGVSQNLYELEQIVFFPSGSSVKIGGLIAPRQDNITEWMLYGGFNFLIISDLRIEPLVYFSKASASENSEQRLLINGHYHFRNNHILSAGFFVTNLNTPDPTVKENYFGSHLFWTLPILNKHWLNFLFRYETGIESDFIVGAVGIKLRLE
jgi:tetratricopeptide (TPR) repeat protein